MAKFSANINKSNSAEVKLSAMETHTFMPTKDTVFLATLNEAQFWMGIINLHEAEACVNTWLSGFLRFFFLFFLTPFFFFSPYFLTVMKAWMRKCKLWNCGILSLTFNMWHLLTLIAIFIPMSLETVWFFQISKCQRKFNSTKALIF